jgi:hypothetical protein
LRPDWIAIDELSEWRRRELWDSLWTATGKRPRCRMLVITTAGWDFTSICWEVRQIAEREADWFFSARGRCATWISEAWLEQQRRTLPAHVFARLHESRWVEGVGAFLTAAEVDAIFTADPPTGPGQTAIGLDLGVSHDRTVAAVVRRDHATGLVVIDALATWRPTAGQRVELPDVEAAVAALAGKVGAPVILDPWQSTLLGQRLQLKGVNIMEFPFTVEHRRRLFGTLLDLIRTRRLRAQPHDDLRRELLALEVEETAAGWRVDHRPGRFDDHVVAVGLAAQAVAGESGAGRGEFILGPLLEAAREWGPTDWATSPWGRRSREGAR